MEKKNCKQCGVILTVTNRADRHLLCRPCNSKRCSTWQQENKGKIAPRKKEYARKYYLEHAGKIASKATLWNRENRTKHNLTGKTWRWRIRLRMIEAYGGKCTCCGETIPEFLSIDHKNDDGYTKRKNGQGSGAALYKELERLGWPKEDYQLHCMNCNFAKGHFGICPHQRK